MDGCFLRKVRETCRAVAERATSVHIHCDRIPSYAMSLPVGHFKRTKPDPASHFFGHPNDTAAFFLTLDTINFGSGYFPHLRKRTGMSGYYTVAQSLKNYYVEHGAISARELSRLTPDHCALMLKQDLDRPPVRELMALFSTALRDLGRYLIELFDGSFVGLIETAGASAEKLVRLLVEMPCFNDVRSYRGFEVAFYKRAQLAASDLYLAFDGAGMGRFDDMDRLTIFADNLVPHVLRIDGILEYGEDLSARIDGGELIPPGSPEEVEIRACAVHAAERIIEFLVNSGHAIDAFELDNILWNRGQQRYYKTVRPRHRTRSVYY